MGCCIASGFYKTLLKTARECNPIRNVLLYAAYVIQLVAMDSQHAFVFKDTVEMMFCSAVVLENEHHYTVLLLFMNV